MKFSKYYDDNILSEWKEFYINYKNLKGIIKPIINEFKEAKNDITFNAENLNDKLIPTELDYRLHNEFKVHFVMELQKVEFFFKSNLKFYNNRLNKITEQLEYINGEKIYLEQFNILELALKELYKDVNLMKHYIHLNFKAKSKLLEKYLTYTKHYTNKPQFEALINEFIKGSCLNDSNRNLFEIGMMIETLFSNNFNLKYGKNANKVLKEHLAPIYLTGEQSFYFGFTIGISLILIIICFLIGDYYNLDIDNDPDFKTVFPMFRGYSIACIYMWLLAVNVYAWDKAHVNYKLCFQFKNHYSHFISILTRASVLTSIYVIMILSYLVLRIHLPILINIVQYIPIKMTPLICWAIFLIYILLPIFNTKGMLYTYKILIESCMINTEFKHIWFLDQITSFIGPLRDIEYTFCYYSNYERPIEHVLSVCDNNRAIVLFIGILPHILRTLQCIKIMLSTSMFPQVLNMIKYLLAIMVAILSFVAKRYNNLDYIWMFTALISTIFSTYWDIKHDFGFLEKGFNYPLRDKLSYKNKSFYYFVLVSNVFLRFIWVLSVSPEIIYSLIRPEFLMLMVYAMEVIRRGIWNFIRVENQHIKLCKEFRVVEYVDLPFKKDKDGNFIIKNINESEQIILKQEERIKKLQHKRRESVHTMFNLKKRGSIEITDPEIRKSVLINFLQDYNNDLIDVKKKEDLSESSSSCEKKSNE